MDRGWAGKCTEQTKWPGLVWAPQLVQREARGEAGCGRGQGQQACGQSPGMGGPGSKPGLVDPESVKGSRAGGCHQTPSLVCGRDGARGLSAGRSGQRRDPVAEVSEKVTRGCLKEEGQRSLQLYTKVTPNDGRRLHGDKPGSRVLGPPVSEVTVASRR